MKAKTKIFLLASALAISLSCSVSAISVAPVPGNEGPDLVTNKGVYLSNIGGSLYQDPHGNQFQIQIIQINGDYAITSDGKMYAIAGASQSPTSNYPSYPSYPSVPSPSQPIYNSPIIYGRSSRPVKDPETDVEVEIKALIIYLHSQGYSDEQIQQYLATHTRQDMERDFGPYIYNILGQVIVLNSQ